MFIGNYQHDTLEESGRLIFDLSAKDGIYPLQDGSAFLLPSSITSSSRVKTWEQLGVKGNSWDSQETEMKIPWIIGNGMRSLLIHPWSLTWNLKISHWKRRFVLEIIILRFHVKLWGCMQKKQPTIGKSPILRSCAGRCIGDFCWGCWWRVESLYHHLKTHQQHGVMVTILAHADLGSPENLSQGSQWTIRQDLMPENEGMSAKKGLTISRTNYVLQPAIFTGYLTLGIQGHLLRVRSVFGPLKNIPRNPKTHLFPGIWMPKKRLSFQNSLRFFFYGWPPPSSKRPKEIHPTVYPKVVLIHGLGVGITPYLRFIRASGVSVWNRWGCKGGGNVAAFMAFKIFGKLGEKTLYNKKTGWDNAVISRLAQNLLCRIGSKFTEWKKVNLIFRGSILN